MIHDAPRGGTCLGLAVAGLVVAQWAAPAVAGCPSTAGCPEPAFVGGEPTDDAMAVLLESAAANALGSNGPQIPNLSVGNPSTGSQAATFPCTLLKAIAYTESGWSQFCASPGGTGPTVISFDCGYGVTQVTSGMVTGSMGVLSFDTARVAQEPAYNIGTGAGILAVKWLSTPAVGDNQPTIVEHWYYATWAYNGFAFVNNPNNPDFPSSRPPFNSPSSLSRGSYPYQELVWGYMGYPAGGRWDPLPVTYPSSSAIGTSPGDIPAPSPPHTDPCGGIVVDDLDPGFTFIQGGTAVTEEDGPGYAEHIVAQHPYGIDVPYTVGQWTPDLPATALYALDVYVPASPYSTESAAHFDISFLGGHSVAIVDLSTGVDEWVELAPGQHFKFAAGQRGSLSLSNLSTSPDATWIAWDAVRFRYEGPATGGGAGAGCVSSADCGGDLVCTASTCTSDCVQSGCTVGTCDPFTGLCIEEEAGDDDDTGDGTLPDTDHDGIPNGIEGPDDSDGDGVGNWFDLDSDGDGIPDVVEGFLDSDGDGWPDFLDEDSDGDGMSDWTEAGSDASEPMDTDGDGVPDFLDGDSDGDSISDADERGEDPADPPDTDGDGFEDFRDEDADGDGILDVDEAGPGGAPVDTDGDGAADNIDNDSDADGLSDSWEGSDDSDGDGTADFQDEDSDDDGTPDAVDPDSDGDGVIDIPSVLLTEDPGAAEGLGCGCGQGARRSSSPLAFPLLALAWRSRRRR